MNLVLFSNDELNEFISIKLKWNENKNEGMKESTNQSFKLTRLRSNKT